MNPIAWLIGLILPACGFAGAAGIAVPPPMDFSHIERPSSPNTALAAPAGFLPQPDIQTRGYPVPAPALSAALRAMAAGQPRVYPLAAYPDRLQMHWVARSAVFNFPDLISAEIRPETPETSTIVLYSRSIYGQSDFGVNRARIDLWLNLLAQAVQPPMRPPQSRQPER